MAATPIDLGWLRDLDKVVRAELLAIYEVSFPRELRIGTGDLVTGVQQGKRQLLVARRENAVAGFATMVPLEQCPAVLLEYMAVSRGLRGKGVGTALFTEVRRRIRKATMGRLILEADTSGSDGRKRLAFFQRCGATVVVCAPMYRIPSLGGGGDGVPLTLLCHPVETTEDWEPSGIFLQQFVVSVFTEIYGLDRQDPIVEQNLRDLDC